MKRRNVCVVGCTVILFAIVSGVSAQDVDPRARAEGRGRGGPSSPGPTAPFETATIPKDDAEKKILDTLDEITRTQGRMMNVPVQDGRLLRLLAESIDAKSVVEIGTSNGISAIWLCTALRKTGGKLITHEIDAERAELARRNFAKAGVADMVTVVEGDAHETISRLKGPIDLVFIDAEKDGYLDYLKKVLPLVRPGGLVTAHNISARSPGTDFVKEIISNHELETILYMQGRGMSVSLKKR